MIGCWYFRSFHYECSTLNSISKVNLSFHTPNSLCLLFALPIFTHFSIRAVLKVFKGKTITQLNFLYIVVYALKSWLFNIKIRTINVCFLKGSFNNYVDQVLPNFDPSPPSSGQKQTFCILATLCQMTPQPPLLVHVVIECSIT